MRVNFLVRLYSRYSPDPPGTLHRHVDWITYVVERPQVLWMPHLVCEYSYLDILVHKSCIICCHFGRYTVQIW